VGGRGLERLAPPLHRRPRRLLAQRRLDRLARRLVLLRARAVPDELTPLLGQVGRLDRRPQRVGVRGVGHDLPARQEGQLVEGADVLGPLGRDEEPLVVHAQRQDLEAARPLLAQAIQYPYWQSDPRQLTSRYP